MRVLYDEVIAMRRLYDRLPVTFLATATVLGGFGIAQAWSAATANQDTADGVLRDYARVAAWSLGERLRPLFGDPAWRAFEPFLRMRQGDPNVTLPPSVEQFRAVALRNPCPCDPPVPPAFHFRMPIAAGSFEFAGTPPDPDVNAPLAAALIAGVDAIMDDAAPRPYGFAAVAGTTVVYTVSPGVGGLTAWGYSIDDDAVTHSVGRLLTDHSLLPPVLIAGRPNTEVLALTLLAPDGTALFDAGTHAEQLAIDLQLDDELSGLTVRASVLPSVAGDLIIGGLPRSRLPLMFGFFALAAVLTGAAVLQMRRAQELARLRSDFVAGVSHELRTPLAQIRIYADTLALGRADTEDRRRWSVDGLRRETTRLEHLIDNVLHTARAAESAGSAEPHDPARTAGDAVSSFRPLAGRRASLRFTATPGLTVLIPPEPLRQVVCNLLDNAVKYGPRGQTVHTTIEAAGNSVRIVVDDEGPGIDPSERDEVWTMYRRGRGVAGVIGGSGVGLAVVRRIVEDHHGRVAISSSPAGGARFIIELPAGSATAAAPAPAPALTGISGA